MGTQLYGAIQIHQVKQDIYREHWWDVAVFDLGKDYTLSMRLESEKGETRRDEWFPDEAEFGCRLQDFSLKELPELISPSITYNCLLAAAKAIPAELNFRILFWRDQ